jgi:NTP pyrophosphatase (non-canonical NTP hydrolase)
MTQRRVVRVSFMPAEKSDHVLPVGTVLYPTGSGPNDYYYWRGFVKNAATLTNNALRQYTAILIEEPKAMTVGEMRSLDDVLEQANRQERPTPFSPEDMRELSHKVLWKEDVPLQTHAPVPVAGFEPGDTAIDTMIAKILNDRRELLRKIDQQAKYLADSRDLEKAFLDQIKKERNDLGKQCEVNEVYRKRLAASELELSKQKERAEEITRELRLGEKVIAEQGRKLAALLKLRPIVVRILERWPVSDGNRTGTLSQDDFSTLLELSQVPNCPPKERSSIGSAEGRDYKTVEDWVKAGQARCDNCNRRLSMAYSSPEQPDKVFCGTPCMYAYPAVTKEQGLLTLEVKVDPETIELPKKIDALLKHQRAEIRALRAEVAKYKGDWDRLVYKKVDAEGNWGVERARRDRRIAKLERQVARKAKHIADVRHVLVKELQRHEAVDSVRLSTTELAGRVGPLIDRSRKHTAEARQRLAEIRVLLEIGESTKTAKEAIAELQATAKQAKANLQPMPGLGFLRRLRALNVERCETVFHPVKAWNLLEWAGAMAGEAGEAANVAKKIRLFETMSPHTTPPEMLDQLAEEVADTVIYADLLLARCGKDLGIAIAKKFDKVSDQKEWKGERLSSPTVSLSYVKETSFGTKPCKPFHKPCLVDLTDPEQAIGRVVSMDVEIQNNLRDNLR